MISACVVPTMKHGGEVVMVWGALLVTRSVIYLELKAHLTSIATTAFCSDTLSGTIICFSTAQWPNTPSGCLRVIWQRRRVMECCISWPGLHNPPTSNKLRWFVMSFTSQQSEGIAANKCSAYVGTPSRLLENYSRWSWLREYQECAKLSSRLRVATLKNLKYLFNTFFVNNMIPYVLFHSFDVFTIILQCIK